MQNSTISQMRIIDAANSLRKITAIYGENSIKKGAEYSELADILEQTIGKNISEDKAKLLKKTLSKYGVKTTLVSVFYNKNNTAQVVITARTTKHICVKATDIAKVISDVLGRAMLPIRDGRHLITENEREFIFEDATRYCTIFGYASVSKEEDAPNGDSFTYIERSGGKTYAAISDGVGTGYFANKISSAAIEIYEQLIESGFSHQVALKLINEAYVSKNEDNPITLDSLEIDLNMGSCSFIKYGASASFVKRRSEVEIVEPSALPAGVLENVMPVENQISLCSSQYVFLVSDGIVDALPFFDKEQQLAKIIDSLPTVTPQHMARALMDEVVFYLDNEYKDDMTILVVGIWEN